MKKNKNILFCVFSFLFFICQANASGITYAPYKDMTINTHWDNTAGTMVPESIYEISKNSEIKHFSLAFIVNDATKVCTPSWGGSYPMVTQPEGYPAYVWGLSDIQQLKQSGGGVVISFGGQAGTYLSQSCSDASSLEKAYAQVVDTYGVKDLDFDIEGAVIADKATVNKMMQAIALLQQQYSDLKISVTLPVLPTGLTTEGVNVLQTAKDNDVVLTRVNIMAMDYGPSFYPDQMAPYAIQAAQATFDQLKAVYPQATWSMIGVTPMIGVNDVWWYPQQSSQPPYDVAQPERFTLNDVKALVSFAQQNGINFLSTWSVNRDFPCDQKYASPICSGSYLDDQKVDHQMQNQDYDFARAFIAAH